MHTQTLIGTDDAARTLKRTRRTVVRYAENGRLRVAAKAPGSRGAYLFDPIDVAALKAKLARKVRA